MRKHERALVEAVQRLDYAHTDLFRHTERFALVTAQNLRRMNPKMSRDDIRKTLEDQIDTLLEVVSMPLRSMETPHEHPSIEAALDEWV